MMFVGIDPDLHCTSWGVWEDGAPVGAGVIEVPKRKGIIEQAAALEMAAAIPKQMPYFDQGEVVFAVEAQTLHVTGLKQHKRPQDIVTLGNVAGAVLGYLFTLNFDDCVLFPTAKEWKGQIPKAVMQARFYKEHSWGYKIVGKGKGHPHGDYSVPLQVPAGLRSVKPAHWKHVADALMLARWAEKTWKRTWTKKT